MHSSKNNRFLSIVKDQFSSLFKKNNEIRNNVLFLFSGNSIAQIIPILTYPILTRIYTPEAFGIFGVYLSILSIVSVILHLRLELAIPLAKDDEEMTYLIKIGVFTSMMISAIFFFMALAIRNYFYKDTDDMHLWLPIIGLNLFIYSFYLPFRYLAVHRKLFKSISIYDASLSLTTVILRIGLGYTATGLNGLILAHIVASTTCIVLFLLIIKKEIRVLFNNSFKIKKAKFYLRKHKGFPLFNSFHALSNSLASNVPYLIISFFFGKDLAGCYTLSTAILLKPVRVVANSLNAVFYQKHSENLRNGIKSYNFFKKSTLFLGAVSLPLFIVVLFLKSSFFDLLLGDEWGNVSTTVHILLPWAFMVLVSSPISFVPNSTNNQKKYLVYNLVYSFIRISALFAGVALSSYFVSITAYSIAGAFFLGFYLFWFKNLFLSSDGALIKTVKL